MALQGSGQISLANLQTEFGGSNPISLSEYYRNGAYVTSNNTGVPTSGVISLSQFYGTTAQFSFTISSNYSTPQDLRTLAINAGWDQTDYLVVTNNAIISSNTTASPALTISGSFPNGLLFINNHYVVGMGGKGANSDTVGSAGGNALAVGSYITIQNNGTIAGGGGGGGAGASWVWNAYDRSDPGSGGASGLTPAAGGSPYNQPIYGNQSAGPNALGLYTPGGASVVWGTGGRVSSPGGRGGDWGSAGDTGGGPDGAYNYSGYSGGAGGKAVTGNGYVTWAATGTRYGALV